MLIMRTILTLTLAAAVVGSAPQLHLGTDEAAAGNAAAGGHCRSPTMPRSSSPATRAISPRRTSMSPGPRSNQGAIAVEAVYGGSAEIGGSAIFEPMVARGNGLDIMFIAASAPNPQQSAGQFRRGRANQRQHPQRQGPGRQEGLGRPDQQRELRPYARMAAAQRRRSELGPVPGDSVSADGRCAVPEPSRRSLERRAVPDLHGQERQCAGDRLSLPGERAAHGHHLLYGEGELGEGQPRRRPPLQARDRPRHHRPDQCHQGGARRLGGEIYRRQAGGGGGDEPPGVSPPSSTSRASKPISTSRCGRSSPSRSISTP